MLEDIARELTRVRRQLRNSMMHGPGGMNATTIPEWLIDQALRVEVNEYDLLEAWHRDGSMSLGDPMKPPTEIMGIRLYAISPRFQQLPAPGWRIIDPFRKPKSKVAFDNMTPREKIDVTQRSTKGY